jgi:hypothetical protein
MFVCVRLTVVPKKNEQLTQIAMVGDRRYFVPPVSLLDYSPQGFDLVAEVVIVDGRMAEAALENSAMDIEGRRAPRAVNAARQKHRKSARGTAAPNPRGRRPVDETVLRRVLELRDEARSVGARRWDLHAAKALGYSPAYLRQLASRADRELG